MVTAQVELLGTPLEADVEAMQAANLELFDVCCNDKYTHIVYISKKTLYIHVYTVYVDTV